MFIESEIKKIVAAVVFSKIESTNKKWFMINGINLNSKKISKNLLLGHILENEFVFCQWKHNKNPFMQSNN